MRQMADYAAAQIADGEKMHSITRHMLGLYNGYHGARAWRRVLGEELRGETNAMKLYDAAAAIESLLAKHQSDTELKQASPAQPAQKVAS